MENNTNFFSEQTQTSSELPTHGFDSPGTNEERFNYLQDEMFTLKAMMENLIQQNEERDRQMDTPATTSSIAVWASNMVTGVNRTHKHQRNHFHDDEFEEDYKDTSSNSTETALLNAIQDLPRKLQKTNTKLLQTHVRNFGETKDKYNEFEHLLHNVFLPIANKITEKIKSTSSRALFAVKPSTFDKRLKSTQPPHCKTSFNFSERSLQRKTCERSLDTNGMKPNTT